jgi:hypothetical protein
MKWIFVFLALSTFRVRVRIGRFQGEADIK